MSPADKDTLPTMSGMAGAEIGREPSESPSARRLRERLERLTEEAREVSRVLPQAVGMSTLSGGLAEALLMAQTARRLGLGVMLGCWMLVRNLIGPWGLAGAMLTVKASDMGAYFTGMAIGRHKMIPWLSPAKSWEGLAGGIAFAAAAGGALAAWSWSLDDPRDHVPVALGIGAGAALGLVGTFGDLAESLLKRSAGIKDSGRVLPGMGGVLDVLDSPLLAGPVVWAALHLR